jgi:serine/threonine protein kinase/Tol biopolymer transport system component
MALTIGAKLGPYEVISAIGAGGMGEVYKARDTRLSRTVAIKVLPERVAADPERKQRFNREARAIAALNHPNICVVHDIGEDNGTHYLVMEYVEGETLTQRLEKGALPLDEAIEYAIEIADALHKAHQQGIVHRDIKPGNIMITKSGSKLLDFGLAKLAPAVASSEATAGNIAAPELTAQGVIMGTLQYMAPEQIEGEDVDARADIFAFGSVLYEMITGKKAFKGKSQASLIASILEHNPVPMSALQKLTPPVLDHVVATCLEKKPSQRWQSAGDLALELNWISNDDGRSQPVLIGRGRRNVREVIAWSALAAAIVGLIMAVTYLRTPTLDTPAAEFLIGPPENTSFTIGGISVLPFPSVSPDGRHVAFVTARTNNALRIWVRSIDSSEPRELPGTDGGIAPFWSADSREIAFFAAGQLKRVEYSGGPVLVVANSAANVTGGSWNRDGTILFAPNSAGALFRISATGGEATPVTTLDASRKETAHRWPFFLPDGKHFLYVAEPTNAIYVGDLGSKETKRLFNADSKAIYVPPGFLLFMRQGTLLGQAFSADRLELRGEPFRIAENVRSIVGNIQGNGAAAFSASNTGVLVYRSGAGLTSATQTLWFDRTGKQLDAINQTGDSRYPQLSRDESRIAVQRQDGASSDIWIIDALRGTNSRLTFNPGSESFPIWFPDGKSVIYASNQDGRFALYQKAATGAGSEELLFKADGQDAYPLDVSPDGKFLLFRLDDPKTSQDIWSLPLTGERKPSVFLQTPFVENGARFSPDGRWVAYWSTESGSSQIYVQPFPPTGGKWQISIDGGSSIAWGRDGKELFFINNNRMFSVDYTAGAEFQARVPKMLFQVPALASATTGLRFSVTHDGKRFLMPVTSTGAETPVTVVLNWTAKLKK